MRLISAGDIPQIPESIPFKKVNPHIEEAQYYELRPKLGEELYTDLTLKARGTTGYGIESRPKLDLFSSHFVQPFLRLATLTRFLTDYGHDIAPVGLIKSRDPRGSYEQLSAAERSDKIQLKTRDKNVREREMMKFLREHEWKIDGVQYEKKEKKKASGRKFRISPIKNPEDGTKARYNRRY